MNRPEVAVTLALALAKLRDEQGREFELYRKVDVTGMSGVGVVADGLEFGSGTVVLRWHEPHASVTVWPSIDEVLAVHGHGGNSVVRYADEASVR